MSSTRNSLLVLLVALGAFALANAEERTTFRLPSEGGTGGAVAGMPPAEPTREGAALRDALLREAELPLKEGWRPLLRKLADLHGRSVLPPVAHLKHPFETMGPGYENGRVFGHFDLTHVRLDTLRASPEHVRNQIENELAGQQADGLIPGVVLFGADGQARWKNFKGFPPVWVVAADAYVEATGDTRIQRECLDALRRQIGWFEAKRAVAGGGFYYLDQVEDTWESGVDEGVRYHERPPQRSAAVDATSHMYLLYDTARRWSERLGEPAQEWATKAVAVRDFIRTELWDPPSGFFYDHWVMKDPARRHLTFEGMWPLVVGAATAAQAATVIDRHLLNPREFYTAHPIATVALSDPAFELRMWRGPTWNSMVYWAARGMIRYGRGEAAHQMLERALDATAQQFERTGKIWEFYHPQLGDQVVLQRKPNARKTPWASYVGHNPLFAMADLWRKTAPADGKTGTAYQQPGIVNRLPVFADQLKARLTFPLSWTSGRFSDFGTWRETARQRVRAALQNEPPKVPWQATVIGEEDRGTYLARKIVFNVSGDSRVLAFMTVPKGTGPFPAVLLLHDHGARFDIGKEKVIRPFAGDPRLASAEQYAATGYGGRFVGDELARRGYVCLAIDALNWGDRGGGGAEAQASIASNLMHLGMSFAGLIAWEDLRSADFLAEQPGVDPKRIAAVGWSLGAFRTWQIAALSDRIAAGAAICWMTDIAGVMTPGNNQTVSNSAFTMLHPGLFDELDYPDIASIACPKPMLFFNGRQDRLFSVDSVERAYAKMHRVWESQGAAEQLRTELWDTPHIFNAAMQDQAFAWLDRVLNVTSAGGTIAAPAATPVASGAVKSPEVTWSLMHPRAPDPAYMREVIAQAAHYHVDSFEVCGDAHGSSGGIDGAIFFRDYPQVAAGVDRAAAERSIRDLREVGRLAHESGRPVYYWHREVMVPRAVVDRLPGLLDANGEFDLLGETYHALVRAKIREFFANVPEIDGLVLTLTESDFSVIHNSDPHRYPPATVVAKLLETFSSELRRAGKRFVLRSFGSIAQDYEDILAGAAMMPAGTAIEVETKITPFDFSPFLNFNPYLRRIPGLGLSAEYDSIGEFLGAGFLPAPDPARVIASVGFARERGVDRHVIRVDRIGHPTFRSTQEINLLAFDRAVRDPAVSADAIWTEWAERRWPGCRDEMVALMQRGIEMVKKTNFIDGHLIFHAFPIQPELKWIQAGGILSVFTPGVSLAAQQGMWGILTDRTTPSRAAILREKDEAVAMADAGLAQVQALRARLTPAEYDTALKAWRNATVATRAVRAWCRAAAAYFDDMEKGRAAHPQLDAAIGAARRDSADGAASAMGIAAGIAAAAREHEYGSQDVAEDTVEAAYLRPILAEIEAFPALFAAEFRERREWQARSDVVDFVVPGGFVDDIRVQRAMHASHAVLVNDRPARAAGNRVFPNGYLEVRLAVPGGAPARLVVRGDVKAARELRLTIDGRTSVATFDGTGEYVCDLPRVDGKGAKITVRIQKEGQAYPLVYGLGVIRSGAARK